MRVGTGITPIRVSQSQRTSFSFGQWPADAVRLDFQRRPTSQPFPDDLTSLTRDVHDLAFTHGSPKLCFNIPRVGFPYQHALLTPQDFVGLPGGTVTALVNWPVGPTLVVQPPPFA